MDSAPLMTDGTLADRLRRVAKRPRAFNPEERVAFEEEAARRLDARAGTMQIKILPDVSLENGWLKFESAAEYRPWAQENAPWVFDWAPSDTSQGVACLYSLVSNGDTYLESLVFCEPDGPANAPMWVLLVEGELSGVTALRMAMRAFADMREETGEGSPSGYEVTG